MYTQKQSSQQQQQQQQQQTKATYRFKLMNMKKASSLYSSGMLPLFFSRKEAEPKGTGWIRIGDSIRYSPASSDGKKFALSFSCSFPR